MKLRQLEMQLQKVRGFSHPSAEAEQYMTPAPLAARMLFHAAMNGDIAGIRVCDLGCGTGMLSIAAALLGADVIAVDFDPGALAVARENAELFDVDITFISVGKARTAAEVDVQLESKDTQHHNAHYNYGTVNNHGVFGDLYKINVLLNQFQIAFETLS